MTNKFSREDYYNFLIDCLGYSEDELDELTTNDLCMIVEENMAKKDMVEYYA